MQGTRPLAGSRTKSISHSGAAIARIGLMRHPWANILLIVLVAAERLTGYLGLTHSNPAWFASMRVHRILGFAILALFIWKSETFWFRKPESTDGRRKDSGRG